MQVLVIFPICVINHRGEGQGYKCIKKGNRVSNFLVHVIVRAVHFVPRLRFGGVWNQLVVLLPIILQVCPCRPIGPARRRFSHMETLPVDVVQRFHRVRVEAFVVVGGAVIEVVFNGSLVHARPGATIEVFRGAIGRVVLSAISPTVLTCFHQIPEVWFRLYRAEAHPRVGDEVLTVARAGRVPCHPIANVVRQGGFMFLDRRVGAGRSVSPATPWVGGEDLVVVAREVRLVAGLSVLFGSGELCVFGRGLPPFSAGGGFRRAVSNHYRPWHQVVRFASNVSVSSLYVGGAYRHVSFLIRWKVV